MYLCTRLTNRSRVFVSVTIADVQICQSANGYVNKKRTQPVEESMTERRTGLCIGVSRVQGNPKFLCIRRSNHYTDRENH